MDSGSAVLLILLILVGWIWLSYVIGKAVGAKVSHGTGMILGVIGIITGFAAIAGIVCIVYSQKNRSGATVGINLNPNSHPDDIFSKQNVSSTSGDTMTCPYCAETIKRKAIVCRFCGKDINSS